MEENKRNLPMVQNNGILAKAKRSIPKVSDGIKRIGKIAGAGAITLGGITAFAIGNVPVAIARFCNRNSRSI